MSPSSGADATMRQPPTPLSTSIYLCLQQPHVCSNAEDEPRWFDGQLKANEVIVWANIEQFKFNRYSKDQLKDILLQILQDMDSKEDTSRASAGNKVSVPAPKRMNIGKHDIKSLEPGEYVNDNVIDVSSPCTPSSTSVLFPCAAALLMGWFCCVQGCWAEV